MKVFKTIQQLKTFFGTILTNLKQSKAGKLVLKLHKHIQVYVAVKIATIRMKLGITAVSKIHKYQSKHYLDPNYKTLCQYIVILERPIKHKRYFISRQGLKLQLKFKLHIKIEERLFWVNFKNFKAIKKAGWLPKQMCVSELRSKAFYVSSMKRNYQEEYKAKHNAITKYTTYIKSQQSC